MTRDIFTPADILLPDTISPEIWSVIACDQFSSEHDYWERVKKRAGKEPSTINLIIPEAYLTGIDEEQEISRISAAMDDYCSRGILREVKNSYIYVERTLTGGRVRRGVIGAIDLEEYDYSGREAAILASEGTVLERLPVRIKVRSVARLELPHIMSFIDDRETRIIETLSEKAGALPLLYDSDLMEGGGHIRGIRVSGDAADFVGAAMRTIHEKSRILMVIGDGNHSLAAAKSYWDELKRKLGPSGREDHPARRALVEVNNVYDPAISFEAIHRVIWGADPQELVKELEKATPRGAAYELQWVSRDRSGVIGVRAKCVGDMLTELQNFLDGYIARNGCRIDYIHGEDTVRRLSENDRCLGLILPAMDKSELFATVAAGSIFPKKSFSVGNAGDKRYYLECRAISI